MSGAFPPPKYTDVEREAVAAALNGWGREKLTGPAVVDAANAGTLQEGLAPFALTRSAAYKIAQDAREDAPPVDPGAPADATPAPLSRTLREVERVAELLLKDTTAFARRHARRPTAEKHTVEGERERRELVKSLREYRAIFRPLSAPAKGTNAASGGEGDDPEPRKTVDLANLLSGDAPVAPANGSAAVH